MLSAPDAPVVSDLRQEGAAESSWTSEQSSYWEVSARAATPTATLALELRLGHWELATVHVSCCPPVVRVGAATLSARRCEGAVLLTASSAQWHCSLNLAFTSAVLDVCWASRNEAGATYTWRRDATSSTHCSFHLQLFDVACLKDACQHRQSRDACSVATALITNSSSL